MKYRDENSKQAILFKYVGFADYVAARKLLLGDYCFQGIILASTAVEKYLKSVLITKGLKSHNHLDKLNKFYSQFEKIDIPLQEKLDSRFMELISRVYHLRYMDKIKEVDNIGFMINQVICELDYTIKLLDDLILAKSASGNKVESQLELAFKDKNHDIHINNYISLCIEKEDFMKRPSRGFGFKVYKNGEIHLVGIKEIISDYNGQINCFRVD